MKAILATMALLLAGCGADVAPAAIQECQEESCQVTVDDVPDPLKIDGVIVDETITPVAGVGVRLYEDQEKLAEVTTGTHGVFAFKGLEEGFYRLVADGEGFTRTETQVDLRPDMGTIRMQVTTIPPVVPIHDLTVWDGFITCSTYTVILTVSLGCGAAGIVTGNQNSHDRARHFWDETMAAGRPPAFLQSEMYWESQQAMGDHLAMGTRLYHPDDIYGDRIGRPSGTSPLAFAMDATAINEHGIGQATNISMPHAIRHDIWADGPNIATPGIVVEQPFTLYFSLFYDQTPPEGWMFVTHGKL